MSENTAIKICGVKKQYRLGQIGGGTLQGDLQSWWARKMGKEDPNSKIDSDQRLVGQTFMALNGIDLEIKQGEAVGIIGKNGAGKSTLLKLLSRVTAPTDGTIDIYGRVTSMLEVGTGFHGEMTGRENVYMNGAILGMTKTEIDRKMKQIIEFSEVGDFIDTPVKRYSSGMYVKLAFSVAAHLDSEIMIMDEVLAVGDMAFQQKCLDKMSDASRTEGKTVLYVSHNMNTIRKLCTRCIVLDEGKVLFDGDVEDGIGMYLNSSEFNSTEKDLRNINRPKWLKADAVRLTSLQYIKKDTIVFVNDELLRLRYKWHSKNNICNVGIRFEIRNNENMPIAAAFNYNVFSSATNEDGEQTIGYDISLLAPGRYKTVITLFQVNSLNGNLDIDCVRGLDFIKDDSNQMVEWKSNLWGYINLNPGVAER